MIVKEPQRYINEALTWEQISMASTKKDPLEVISLSDLGRVFFPSLPSLLFMPSIRQGPSLIVGIVNRRLRRRAVIHLDDTTYLVVRLEFPLFS